MRLKDWQKENWPDPDQLYAKAAQEQITWVRNSLAYMVWNSLLPPPQANSENWSIEDREATMTVDGTHRSKSILLPVYKFEVGGVTTKIRGNFHDWCVKCWTPMKREFPEWMNVSMGTENGFYEGMEEDKSPTSFCVRNQEQLFATLWWMYNEGIKD